MTELHETIILGVTPLSLTKGSARDSVFLEYINKPKSQKRMVRYCGRLLQFFRPYSPVEAMRIVKPSVARRDGFEEYASDGWLASHAKTQKVFSPGPYADIFDLGKNGPVSTEIVEELMTTIKGWTKNGITVYGFRPPTVPEMTTLENQRSRFDETAFTSRFVEAGGEWLEFDFDAFETIDGSHLSVASALEFSRILAHSISARPSMKAQKDNLKGN